MRSGTMLKVSPSISAEVVDYWINLAQIDQVKCTSRSGHFFYSVILAGQELFFSEEEFNRIKKELALP